MIRIMRPSKVRWSLGVRKKGGQSSFTIVASSSDIEAVLEGMKEAFADGVQEEDRYFAVEYLYEYRCM